MKVKAAGLALALLAAPAVYATECPDDVEQRLAVLEEAFDDQILGLDIWSGSWAGIYTALTMGQSIAALTANDAARGELLFGAVGAGVGALSAGLLPLRFTIPLRNIRAEWDNPDRCALLVRAEHVRDQVAREQGLGKGWLAHVGNVLINVGLGLTLWLAFHNWQAGLVSGGVGVAIGEINLLSQPTKLKKLAAPPPAVRVVPVVSREFTGAGLIWAF